MILVVMDVRYMSLLLSPNGHMIVDQGERVTMTPPHYHMSNDNSLSPP
jgi:hypothetical protein